MELLKFKYVPTLDDSFRVYSDDIYLGKVTKRLDGWANDHIRDMGRVFKSRRASAMRLFALNLPLDNRLRRLV